LMHWEESKEAIITILPFAVQIRLCMWINFIYFSN